MSIQPLPPVMEDSEELSQLTLKYSNSQSGNMLRASLKRKDFPLLAPPPEFAPAPPTSTKHPSSVSSPQLMRRVSTNKPTAQPPPAPPTIAITEHQLPPPGHPFSSAPPPPPPPGGGPPPPPPPPPIIQQQPKSLSEMIQQHKLKTKQQQATSGDLLIPHR